MKGRKRLMTINAFYIIVVGNLSNIVQKSTSLPKLY